MKGFNYVGTTVYGPAFAMAGLAAGSGEYRTAAWLAVFPVGWWIGIIVGRTWFNRCVLNELSMRIRKTTADQNTVATYRRGYTQDHYQLRTPPHIQTQDTP